MANEMAGDVNTKSNETSEKMDNYEENPKNVSTTDANPVAEIEIKASQIITRLEQAAEGHDQEENVKPTGEAWTHPTVFLGPEQKSAEDILNTLEDLMICDEEDGDCVPLCSLDEVSMLTIVSHSISAYASTLDRQHLQKLSARLITETTRWLSHMFRFFDCAACYHDDHLEGLVRVTRMTLHYKYPRYLDEGGGALASSPPSIYSSVSSPLGVVQHLCRQLGLPLSCVRPVPVNTMFGSQHTMDISALQRMVGEDSACGRTPLLVLADAGTPITGHCDALPRLAELCSQHGLWLHLQGHTLAALALPPPMSSPPSPDGTNNRIADSFTLNLGTWLGVPGLPMVTLYRLYESKPLSTSSGGRPQVSTSRESTLPLVAGLSGAEHQLQRGGRRLPCLPLWAALQSLGRNNIHARLRNAFHTSEMVWRAVNGYRSLRVLSPPPGGEGSFYAVADLISKPVNTALLFEAAVSCVVFQFIPEVSEDDVLRRVPTYFDKLNSWFGQVLQRDIPQVPIQICEVENFGIVLRCCPLEAGPQQPTPEELDLFVRLIEQHLEVMSATVRHKVTLKTLVEESPVLKLVDIPDWAGLGGVRYVPEAWEQLLTDQTKEELNRLNIALVEHLKSTDNAFSLGEGDDGLACVRFGLVTDETDLESLLSLVINVGRSVEENCRVLDSMTEIVKKGIETATMDLQKENEERMWQEGILRQVPVVGTFVNWWSPRNKDTGGVRGRSLNLTQGVVESTENIYRYHMQLPGGQPSVPGTRVPPQPLVQTQVGTGTHSRSSSHSSSLGGLGQINTTVISNNINSTHTGLSNSISIPTENPTANSNTTDAASIKS